MPQILSHTCHVLYLVLALLFSMHVSTLCAQQPHTVKELQLKGDFALKQGDIYSAVSYYEQALEKYPSNFDLLFQLGKLQMEVRDYAAAHKIFKSIYTTRPAQFPLVKYYYGISCKRIGDYETALTVLTEFQKEYKGTNYTFYKNTVKREIEGARLALVLLLQSSGYSIVHPGTGINSAYTDFSPVYLNDSSIIYAALKADSLIKQDASAKKLTYRARFYEAKKDDGRWVTIGEMRGAVNTKKAETGNGSYSADGRRFYFTRCVLDKEYQVVCQIYMTEQAGKGWSAPKKIKDAVNVRGATSTHPFVARAGNGDDLLYFASDRTGGEGKLDIWCAQYNLKTRKWSAPKNLGKRVNTGADEMTPYYDKKMGYLYFSSDGWPSVGGLDVFKVKGEDTRFKSFPENLGFPVNSGADEMYYTMNKTNDKGFIVSNREGATALKSATCCDDIFEITVDRTLRFAVSGVTAFKPTATSSTQILPGATVRVYMAGSEIPVGEAVSDQNGVFSLELNPETDYYITVQKENLFSYRSERISTKGLLHSDTLTTPEIVLSPLVKQPVKIDNIYFEYDSVHLNESSRAAIDTTIYRLLVANPNVILEISAHTDNIGTQEYNLKLSQVRAQMVVSYLIEKGIASERLQPKGYGASQPLVSNTNPDGTDNPAGRTLNRRIEFRIIGEVAIDPEDSIYSDLEEK